MSANFGIVARTIGAAMALTYGAAPSERYIEDKVPSSRERAENRDRKARRKAVKKSRKKNRRK